MTRTAALLLLALMLGGVPALAAQEHGGDLLQLDAQRSSGGFRVRVIWLLGVNGTFGRIEGDVRRDRFHDSVRVAARVDAASLRMASARYENLARSPEFFDVARHPRISFTSDSFARQRLRDGGDLPGRLTVRGIEQPVRFTLLPADCARPAYDCPLRINGSIRRSQFGMDSHRATLADKVELDLRIYLQGDPAHETLTAG